MAESWTVNSDFTLEAYLKRVRELYREHRYLTFPPPRIGEDRSLLQNSLFHVWLTEFAAHLTPCHPKEVTPGMLAGIKRTVKQMYYHYSHADFMIQYVECPLTGRIKKDFTSSASWKRGEMFDVLTWLQLFAADKGCVLESKGEFRKLQREAEGIHEANA